MSVISGQRHCIRSSERAKVQLATLGDRHRLDEFFLSLPLELGVGNVLLGVLRFKFLDDLVYESECPNISGDGFV